MQGLKLNHIDKVGPAEKSQSNTQSVYSHCDVSSIFYRQQQVVAVNPFVIFRCRETGLLFNFVYDVIVKFYVDSCIFHALQNDAKVQDCLGCCNTG